jgi:predicted RNA binding protein YcfA (HicA-like mRNA interferase family)
VSRRDKLIEKMRSMPDSIRFGQLQSLLRYEGFVLFNQRGSHCTYHRKDGRALTIVHPHGRHKKCHPNDIRRVLKVLDL